MRIFRQIVGLDTIERAVRVVQAQQESIKHLHYQLARAELQYARSCRDLIGHFLYSLENEIDVAEQLRAGLRDLNDEVARLEEHAPR